MVDEDDTIKKSRRRTVYPVAGFPARLHQMMLLRGIKKSDLPNLLNNVRDPSTPPYGRWRHSQWLNGENMPNHRALTDLTRALKCGISDLMPLSEATYAGSNDSPYVNKSDQLPDGRVSWHFKGKLSPRKYARLLAILAEPED